MRSPATWWPGGSGSVAAKAKVAPASKKAAATKKTTKVKAKPKGLQLSAAQFRAYNKAFSATAQKLSRAATIRAFATGLRKYRLQAANSTIRKYAIARGNAQAAAVASHAASMSLKQSVIAHQNIALQQRIGQDAFRHSTLLGRMQFAQAGVKAYAHAAVMRTVTQAQAVSIESKFLNKVVKNAKRNANKSRKAAGTPLSKSIAKAANAAGLAAAKKTPKGKAAPSGRGRGRPKGSTKGASSQAAKAANIKTNQKAAASSAKAPAKTAKSRTSPRVTGEAYVSVNAISQATAHPAAAYAAAMYTGYSGENPKVTTGSRQDWVGNEFTPNCIVTAIANHLLYIKSVRVTKKEVEELTELAGDEPTIESVLWEVWRTGWPGRAVHLGTYREIEDSGGYLEAENLVIGFEVRTDDGWQDHCALSRANNTVVSWGTEMDRESLVEEAWELTWQALREPQRRYSWRC
jgi:hypothetical protein